MRRTILLLAGVLLCVVALGADSPKEYDDKVQVDELEGTWRLTEIEWRGVKSEIYSKKNVLIYHSRTFTFTDTEGETTQGSYRIDKSHNPPHLDWFVSSGPNKGRTVKHILQIDCDKLTTVCIPFDSDKRPQGFKDDGIFVQIYKRVR